MDKAELKPIVEAALFAAGRPLPLDRLRELFGDEASQPSRAQVREAIAELEREFAGRSIELREVSGGWRIQVKTGFSDAIGRLWAERPNRYSRALLETLALIAYRQPITRGEIEEVRGVTVSTSIMKTLLDRDWVRLVGHRDVPGRPGLYGTTREFLDYFGLKSLDELPTLAELRDFDSINIELDFGSQEDGGTAPGPRAIEEPAVFDDDG